MLLNTPNITAQQAKTRTQLMAVMRHTSNIINSIWLPLLPLQLNNLLRQAALLQDLLLPHLLVRHLHLRPQAQLRAQADTML